MAESAQVKNLVIGQQKDKEQVQMTRKKVVTVLASVALAGGLTGCAMFNKHEARGFASDGTLRQCLSDDTLRAFLGVHTMRASYDCPKSTQEQEYEVVILECENGGLVRTGTRKRFHMPPESDRKLNVEMVWGLDNGKCRVSFSGSNGSCITFPSEFWGKLDGTVAEGGLREYEGYRILCFAQSSAKNNGTTDTATILPFNDALKEKKYVGALGVRVVAHGE